MVRVLALAGTALLVVSTAHARPYPTNACVGAKEKAAGRYCEAALAAWSAWETKQDDAKRDAALARAAAKVDGRWTDAETESSNDGVDCADTTLSAPAARQLVDSAIAALLDEVNDGLDLGRKADAKCGAKILDAAATKCGALLDAEGTFVKALADDPHGTARDAAEAKARAKFAAAFGRQAGCGTTATATSVESAVDGIVAAVVRNTTVSPNLDDTQFTEFSPTGPIEYLGKTLTPICMNGSPYHYFAKRGSENKLLVYYQGGGACWEQLTCTLPACDTSVTPGDNPDLAMVGFGDRSNPNNPFRDWNVVFVAYCSCDIHFGDAAQDYGNVNPATPIHVEHRGFDNSRVVEKFAREHFVNPERVFVTGSSAGAYGAWFNAGLHEEVWPASHFDVLADAGNGVVTQQFIDDFFPNWNFVGNIPPEFPEIKDIILNGGGVPEYTLFVANHFPETRWAHYASAFDGGTGGQTGFYNIMLNDNNPIAALTWWNGSCAFNAKMREQAIASAAALPSNYRYYIGTGSRHTMWGSNKVYTDTTGGVPTIVDWVNAMLDGTSGWTNVEAMDEGLLLPGDPRPSPLQPPFQQVGSDVKVVCSPSGAFLDGAPFE